MPELPTALGRLLSVAASSRDEAWQAFVREYSPLFLHVARSISADRDHTMDAYAHVLEELSREDYRRLRSYAPSADSKFTTWLVVVTRRACVDFQRRRFGRHRESDSATTTVRRSLRRRLEDLVSSPEELDRVAGESIHIPDVRLAEHELAGALEDALSTLTDSDRLLLKLRFEDDHSAADIARALAFPSPFHVYRRLNFLLRQLRGSLLARGVESSVP